MDWSGLVAASSAQAGNLFSDMFPFVALIVGIGLAMWVAAFFIAQGRG